MQPIISPLSESTRVTRRTATATGRPKRKASSPTLVSAKPPVRPRKGKKKVEAKPKEKEAKYLVMGMHADVKDEKGRWSEARIIEVDEIAQKVKVHFLGWHKRFDTWANVNAIAPHGAHVASVTKDEKSLKKSQITAAFLFRTNPNYAEKALLKEILQNTLVQENIEVNDEEHETEAVTRERIKRKVADIEVLPQPIEVRPQPKSASLPLAKRDTSCTAAPASGITTQPPEPALSQTRTTAPVARVVYNSDVVVPPPANTKTVLAEIFRQRVQQQIAELVENQKEKAVRKQHQTKVKPPQKHGKRHDAPKIPRPPAMAPHHGGMGANMFHRPLQANAAYLQESIDAWRAQQENLMQDITSVVCL
ncbi:hypothetical protein ACHHYP_00086 [Achlya hypogyna]|uniref:Tudor-knot domain-containing protein n=1 Tax=Achlya hypogyna TaxID=1202772 RepID=A0A1V9ZBS1_ACHHY|nr:hypothetical protein ACHHYP_00086 [Achlya hypogyna]